MFDKSEVFNQRGKITHDSQAVFFRKTLLLGYQGSNGQEKGVFGRHFVKKVELNKLLGLLFKAFSHLHSLQTFQNLQGIQQSICNAISCVDCVP